MVKWWTWRPLQHVILRVTHASVEHSGAARWPDTVAHHRAQVGRQWLEHARHVVAHLVGAAPHEELQAEEHEAVQGAGGDRHARPDWRAPRLLPLVKPAVVHYILQMSVWFALQLGVVHGFQQDSGCDAGRSPVRTLSDVKSRGVAMSYTAGQTGSFLNMAPEVVLKKPYNEKADIFSLGCCMFEVCGTAWLGPVLGPWLRDENKHVFGPQVVGWGRRAFARLRP